MKCRYCGKEVTRPRSSFCSEKCYQAYYYKTNIERLTEYKKAHRPKRPPRPPSKWTPEYKRKKAREYYWSHVEQYKQYAKIRYERIKHTPEYKERIKKANKKYYEKIKHTPEYKERMRIARKNYEKIKHIPEYKERMRIARKKYYEKIKHIPEYKERMRIANKNYYLKHKK